MSSICINCPPPSPSDFSLGTTMGDMFKKARDYFDYDSYTISVTSLDTMQRDILSELFEIYYECKEDNWDEAGAKAISKETLAEAVKFFELYPPHLLLPEVVPAVSGALDLEWDSKEARCNVELNGGETIVYAGYFSENDRDFGTKPFKNYIPESLIEVIKRVTNG